MTRFDERVAALSPEKRALLERLLQERGEDVFPLSVAQQGIWFLEQLRPGNPGYLVRAAVRLRGDLDVAVLRAAVDEIVRRHETLRTVFQVRDGNPVQVVRPGLTVDLPLTDAPWRDDRDLPRRVAELLREPFDLTTGPLLRLRLLRVSDREHVLAVAMHHLISDGWSVQVFLAELSALYEAYAAGRPSPLAPLAIQYGDYAVWQRRRGDGHLAAGLDHWRQALAGAPDALPLPTDRPRPPVQGFNGASVPFELPEPVVRGLGDVARQQGATPYMALLAVFHLLMHRYSGAGDVVVGVPLAGRDRAELEPLIGFFVNTLPVRARIDRGLTFRALLDRVRDACLGAYAHQDVPFDKIVAEVRPERDLSRPPIFQTAFSHQSDPLATLTVAGLEIERVPLPAEGARFDIEVQSFDHGGVVRGWFEYDRDLFDEPIVTRMARHFRRLAELAAADPDRPVGRLDPLDAAELAAARAEASGPARDWSEPEPGVRWIHEYVAWQVRRAPHAEAVRFEGESLGYAELDRRAGVLARRLRAAGAGRGTLVGVAVPRSAELVVALLAALKAGAAYVPLDTDLPRARLAYMLGDSAVPVLVTRRDVLDRLPETAAEVLCTDDLDWDGPGLDEPVEVDGEDLAYMIYTSGSTGRPKGVMNVHAAIRNRLLWMQDQYGLTPGDRVMQKTPASFDVSVWEFFWPLMTGATLVVARPGGHRDPGYLVGLIRRERITTLHFVPSMLQVFLSEPGLEECTSLRRVICSGEALTREAQDRLLARTTAELHNLYGPTEAAVDVTHWPCRTDAADPRPVPIGFPIANTTIHVLDERLRPVPKGVVGELHIGGRNLARGYHNRPDLTADRFVPDPYGPPGSRLYRTGDLARVREDGAVEYLGRLDHQVKLRGFRIELGEIEAVLAAHPAVREAIVTAREPRPGDTRLVAYLTGHGEVDVAALRDHLRERLPDYMVPAAFVVLPEMPLTANGKADRAALPEPDLARPEAGAPFVPPRDDLERRIADVWRALLGVDRVGAHDNFFDLGGHSLLMPELRARLTEITGREVTLVELFQYPTVGALAAHLAGPAARPTTGARDRAELRRRSQARRRDARRARDEG